MLWGGTEDRRRWGDLRPGIVLGRQPPLKHALVPLGITPIILEFFSPFAFPSI